MKKTASFLAFGLVIIFILAFIFQPGNVTGSQPGSAGPSSIPDSVMKIIQKSCISCHSKDGNSMAKMHVNFDNWDNYGKKQSSKAQDMCDMITKGKMPPKSFREKNPNSVPTDKEIKTICAWAGSLKK